MCKADEPRVLAQVETVNSGSDGSCPQHPEEGSGALLCVSSSHPSTGHCCRAGGVPGPAGPRVCVRASPQEGWDNTNGYFQVLSC